MNQCFFSLVNHCAGDSKATHFSCCTRHDACLHHPRKHDARATWMPNARSGNSLLKRMNKRMTPWGKSWPFLVPSVKIVFALSFAIHHVWSIFGRWERKRCTITMKSWQCRFYRAMTTHFVHKIYLKIHKTQSRTSLPRGRGCERWNGSILWNIWKSSFLWNQIFSWSRLQFEISNRYVVLLWFRHLMLLLLYWLCSRVSVLLLLRVQLRSHHRKRSIPLFVGWTIDCV